MSNFSRAWHVPPLEELEWLQGSSSDLLQDTALLMLFQPNCPGCHIHAIPTVNELAATKRNGWDVYCVSTAFEDFEFNTKEATNMFLETGALVGDAKARLGPKAINKLDENIPVAYDIIVDKSMLSAEELEIARNASRDTTREQLFSQQPGINAGVVEKMLYKVDPEMLLPEKVARVFNATRAFGTPMWVLHRRSSGEILDRKFGQRSPDELLTWIQPYITK